MEQLNKTPITGKFGDVAKVLDTNFGLIVTKLMELSEASKAKKMNCGFYSSETELKTAYPNPDKGMMAYVGSGIDYTVYRCKTDGKWTATSETFKVNISVDLSTFATKDALAQVKGSVDSLLLGAVYGGIAARTTNPGIPKTKVFYLPTEVGEYPNFSNLSVVENEIAFLYFDGTNWSKQSVDFSNDFNDINDKLSDLAEKKIDKENIAQELGEDETKVASLKCVNTAIGETNKKIDDFNSFNVSPHNKVVEIDNNNHIVSSIDDEDISHEYLSKLFHKDLTVEGEIKGKTMTSFESNISANQKEISQEVEKRENLITDSNHPKYAEVTVDKDNKIIDAIKKDGTRYFHSLESPSLDAIIKMINAIDSKEKTFTESADLHFSHVNIGNNERYYRKDFECNFENGKKYIIVRKETFGCNSQLFPEASSAWNQYVKEFDVNKNLNMYDIFIYDCKEDNAKYLSFRGYTDTDIDNEYWIFKESNKKLNSLLIMLAEIQSKVDDGKLPSYYNEYVQDKTKKIVDAVGRNGYGSSTFFFMSDYHWGANALSSGALLGQLVNKTGIKRIILGGDIPGIGTYDIQSKTDSDTYSLLQTIVHNEQLSRMNTEYIYQSRGNHDIWNKNFNVQEDYTGGYNLQESSALMREPKDFIHNSEDSTRNSTYGYFDDTEAKIRYIIFDTSSIADYGQYGVTLEQLQWIYNHAIKGNTNHYDIIAVGHIELSLIQGSSANGTKSLQNFLYAFSDKTKVTISNQEFDFTESTEKLIAYFHGHEHNDLVVGNHFMQIGICCDTCNNNDS